MFPSQIILKKREKKELSRDEIFSFINQLTHDQVSDSQAGAFLMSCFINGLNFQETGHLTEAMLHSGAFLNYPNPYKPKADKHSTGGVGDKISFLIFPICVACHVAIPMISGRGLGHTGGTLDKLESIIGFKVNLSQDEMDRCMDELGGFIIGQSPEIVPADKILYKIRDVTSTIDHSSLITASILSKKLAERLDFLVLDLKTGKGAFMKTLEDARELGYKMKGTAEVLGLKLKVMITRMDQPLGQAVGNWLEIEETEKCLKGEIPKDIKDLTFALCSEILINCGIAKDDINSYNMINEVIQNGMALKIFYKMIELQGGNWEKSKLFYKDLKYYEIKSKKTGYINSIDSLMFGHAGMILGVSRKIEKDELDLAAGFYFEKKCGDFVQEGETIYRIYTGNEERKKLAEEYLKNAIDIDSIKLEQQNIIVETI